MNIGNIALTLQGDVFSGTKNLSDLLLSSTSLNEMPFINSDVCQSLESLVLSSNNIHSIAHDYFDCFNKLSFITLKDMKLQQVPNLEGVQNLLQSLDLSFNNITDLDVLTTSVYPKLGSLGASDNPITHIDLAHALTYMWPVMTKLNLKNCHLETIDNLLGVPKRQQFVARMLYLEGER